MAGLKDRFIDFCREYPGAEEIDSIPLSDEQKVLKLKKADFFFENRTIICEIKALETETENKAVEFMRAHGLDPAGLSAGQHVVEELFQTLPKGQNLYNDLVKLVTKPVEAGFDSAALQIPDTKRLFNIASADGLLVMLNDSVTMASAPFIVERLSLAVRKKDANGQPYHREVTHILHIGESYYVETANGNKSVDVTLPNPTTNEKHGVEAFARKLVTDWAAYNGQPLEDAGTEIKDLMSKSKLFVEVIKSK